MLGMRDLRLSQALVLRVDAFSNAALAVFLLAATWDRLYEFLGLPVPEPPFYAQLLGAALVAFAILEWRLAGSPAEAAVTFAAAVGSTIAAVVLAVWLLFGRHGPRHPRGDRSLVGGGLPRRRRDHPRRRALARLVRWAGPSYRERSLSARSIWRFASRSAMVRRLSRTSLPRATASSTLARPSFQ